MRLVLRSLLFLCAVISSLARGQLITSDTAFLTSAKKNAIQYYERSIAGQSHLFNGNAYIEYQQQADEHPYFLEDWTDGTLVYDGQEYKNVPLLYDISKDELITDHLYGLNKIQLVSEKIKQFTLNGHTFVHLQVAGMTRGFYEVVYAGNSSVYLRWIKTLQSKISSNTIERFFDDKLIYYIKKENTYYAVKSKKSVFALFADQKAALKKFIRDQSISFKTDRAKAIQQVAAHYDQLKAEL